MATVTLNELQVKFFKEGWFVFGNSGPGHTHMNHGLIQGFLETGENRMRAYKNNMKARIDENNPIPEKQALTKECMQFVEAVLACDYESAKQLLKTAKTDLNR